MLANGIHECGGDGINHLPTSGGVANAVGPIKIGIINPTYTASPCPKDKPIPGEKAMKGMRGLCVRVKAELAENSPKVRVSFARCAVFMRRASPFCDGRAGGCLGHLSSIVPARVV
jgi:hypothetical protein